VVLLFAFAYADLDLSLISFFDLTEHHGGSLLSLLHSYTLHGDPFMLHFTSHLLARTSSPFFLLLSQYIRSGTLLDPFEEFFVDLSPDMKSLDPEEERGLSGRKVWEEKFVFRKEMVPGFLEEGFARKIWKTGKSLNFMRFSCGEGDWVEGREGIGKGDCLFCFLSVLLVID
jgi:gamma-tubulin complex component 3